MREASRVIVLGILLSAWNVAAQSVTVTPDAVTLVPGQTANFEVAPADTTSITATSSAADVATVSEKTIRAIKPGTATINVAKDGTTVQTITVTVKPFSKVVLECERCSSDLVQGETRTVAVVGYDANNARITTPIAFTITSANPAIVSVSGMQLTAPEANVVTNKTETTLRVSVANELVATIPVIVREAIARIEAATPLRLEEGQVAPQRIVLIGTRQTTFAPKKERALSVLEPNALLELTDDGFLRARGLSSGAAQTGTVTLFTDEGIRGTRISTAISVTVERRQRLVTFAPADVSVTPGRVATIRAQLHDINGALLPNVLATWDFKPGSNDDKFLLLSQSKDSVTLHWKSTNERPPDYIELIAHVRQEGGNPVDGTVVVQLLPFPIRFAPLDVRMTLVDEQTAADLFGSVTAREYHVARVRMFNNLRSDDPDVLGASILAFSESIEVAVRYQKRKPLPRSRWQPDANEDVGWAPLSQEELEQLYLLSDGPRPISQIRATQSDEGSSDGDGGADAEQKEAETPRSPACRGSLIYRPYSFEMMVNSVDRRDERSTRSRVFRGLNAIATVGTTLTAVGVGAKSDLPVILEKYGNLFIPGMEKIWPSLRETQRQNVINETMKPIEEIPYGSDLARVVFFPKRGFRGVLEDNEVRIATICPFYFRIEVAILQKNGRIPAGTP